MLGGSDRWSNRGKTSGRRVDELRELTYGDCGVVNGTIMIAHWMRAFIHFPVYVS